MKTTTNSIAVRKAAGTHRADLRTGMIYGEDGYVVGSNVFEPRLSVRVNTPEGSKKYGVRISRLMAFVKYGAQALNPNVQVRHKDGNKFNNAGSNLVLVPRRRGLTLAQIRRIRNLVSRGLQQTAIAERTGTSRYQVARIVNGQAYASVR